MAINLLRDRGIPLDRQRFTWKDLVQVPYSVLDDVISWNEERRRRGVSVRDGLHDLRERLRPANGRIG